MTREISLGIFVPIVIETESKESNHQRIRVNYDVVRETKEREGRRIHKYIYFYISNSCVMLFYMFGFMKLISLPYYSISAYARFQRSGKMKGSRRRLNLIKMDSSSKEHVCT